MNLQQAELYKRLQEFSLDEENVAFSFSQRLARENNWTIEYTQRVIDEYKKFAVIAVFAGHPVTPSDQVDQVWHLHLTYTQSYWHDFCGILGKQLDHGPTRGGNKEYHKFNNWYVNTVDSYQKFFGESPPVDIWPAPHIRFDLDANFQRVDTYRNWVLPKPIFLFKKIDISRLLPLPQKFYLAFLFTLTLILTNSQILLASNNNNSQNYQSSENIIIVGFFIAIASFVIFTLFKSGSSGGGSGGGGCGGGGCGGGGCGGGGCGGGGCGGGGCGGGGCGGGG